MKNVLFTSVACLALIATDVANAQGSSGQLEEIVITAQRRTESLQRAGIAVSAVSGNQLTQAGVTSPERLSELLPAVSITNGSTGSIIFMRGVGNFTVAPTADPASAFNYDGVYVGRPTGTSGVFYDLERIEVLKGPQGTLYGRNATGGAINVLPVQPKLGENSGYGTVSYGNYNAVIAEAALNLALGNSAALRISGNFSDHDGYNKDGTNDESLYGFRVQLKAELSPRLTARISFDYAHLGGIGTAGTAVGSYLQTPGVPTSPFVFVPSQLAGDEGLYSPAAQAYRQTIPTTLSRKPQSALAPFQYNDSDFFGAHGEINYEIDAGTFTLIPAWRLAKPNYLTGAASFPYGQHETDRQYSVEGRFNGKRISIFDYLLGVYYYDEKINGRTALSLSDQEVWGDVKLTTSSSAGFARLTAHVTDQLRVIGGVRYTSDYKTYHARSEVGQYQCLIYPACLPLENNFPWVEFPSQIPFPFPLGATPLGVPPPPPEALLIHGVSTTIAYQHSDRVTYRGGIEFDVTPNSLAYGSIESGYRSGGFSSATGFQTYRPEYLTAYTIGMKNTLFQQRLTLNVEAFLWDYTNQQVTHVGLDLSSPPRVANFTQNIGATRIKGVEIEGRALVTPDDMLTFDVQYLDTRVRKFVYQQSAAGGVPPVTGCDYRASATISGAWDVDCAGKPAQNSPKWTINLGAQHTFHVLNDKMVVLGVNTQYKSSRYVGFYYHPEELAGSSWKTDAQLLFGPEDQAWSVAAFVRNIENKAIPLFYGLNPNSNTLIRNTIAPRVYGLRLSGKF